LIEAPGAISFVTAAAGAAAFALMVTKQVSGTLASRLTAVLWMLVAGPWRFVPEMIRASKTRLGGGAAVAANALIVWLVALALGAIFLALFASANPLIEGWIAGLSFKDSFSRIDLARMLFWLLMMSAAWPFISMSRPRIEEAVRLVRPEEALPTVLPE